jgi:steroid delta-isomerase-like uncharacterized protein
MQIPLDYAAKATEAFNTRKLDQLALLLAPEFHYQDPMGAMTGREATLAREQAIFEAFPDVRVEMEPFAATEDRLAMSATLTGTFTGPFVMGGHKIEPNGKPFSFRFAAFFQFDGGYAVREQVFYDRAELMQALGQGWE